mmetsp:Transcript_12179/g.30411  ORF Transcript_12179/g.30411 Transcript_12179/m.30411 type:complete len:267 (-) Transcript_12179:555-1355(-)
MGPDAHAIQQAERHKTGKSDDQAQDSTDNPHAALQYTIALNGRNACNLVAYSDNAEDQVTVEIVRVQPPHNLLPGVLQPVHHALPLGHLAQHQLGMNPPGCSLSSQQEIDLLPNAPLHGSHARSAHAKEIVLFTIVQLARLRGLVRIIHRESYRRSLQSTFVLGVNLVTESLTPFRIEAVANHLSSVDWHIIHRHYHIRIAHVRISRNFEQNLVRVPQTLCTQDAPGEQQPLLATLTTEARSKLHHAEQCRADHHHQRSTDYHPNG